jgi:hypothetical protein
MDWEQLRERTLGEVATSLVTSGAGVAGGFIGAAFVGRQIENALKPGVIATSSLADKVVAWGANNIPKLAIWYLAKGYAIAPGEAVTPTKEAISDARKAMAGSLVFDTLMRLANNGINPATATVWGWQVLGDGSPQTQKSVQTAQADVQRLVQENSALRTELNKALQRLATPPIPVQVAAPAPVAYVQPVAPQPVAPAIQPVAPAARPVPVAVQQPPVQAMAQQPPVVRYTPVTPYAEQRPVVQMQQAAPRAPVVKITPMAARSAPRQVAAQPVPPAVAERERRYGFMQQEATPQPVQERERKFGFMAGGEKDVATMFGML